MIVLALSATGGAARSTVPLVLEVTHWTPTNAMNNGREFHTLSVLPDGTALAAGGRIRSDSFLNSSEIYTPHTNSWTLVADSMGTHRSSHTATVLLDGRILVAGGENGLGSLSSAEIYDPVTQQWTATGSMTQSRWGHTATRLQDGRVLVVGGCYSGSIPGCTSSVEIYDPASGTWTAKSPIESGARREHTATLLPDGSVLVVGGYRPGTTVLNPPRTLKTADRYFPAADTWDDAGNIMSANGRAHHSAVLRRDGKVVIMGGYESYKPSVDPQITADLTTTEIFDPDDHAKPWAYTALTTPLSVGHQGAAAVLDAEGNFILLGGAYQGQAMSDVSYLNVNSVDGQWTYEFGAMEFQRKNHAAVVLPGGLILIAGGRDQDGNLVPQAETNRKVYGAPDDSGLRSGNYGLFRPAAVMRPNGDILITGGGDKNAGGVLECHNQVHFWDESAQVFDQTSPMLEDRCGHAMTALPDGRVVVFGGFSSLGGSPLRGEIFDGTTWKYLPAGNPLLLSSPSVLLPNGTVLLFPGGDDQTDRYIFDPTTLTSRKILNKATGSYSSHTATLMKNGKVLIIGSTTSDIVEVFDPLTETFEVVPHPNPGFSTRFRNHAAVLLPNGKVMVVGGQIQDGHLVNRAYFYNPDTKTWATGNPIGGGRKFFSLVLLPDGTPVILGGVVETSADPVTSVFALDTQTGVWARAGELLVPRQEHIAHLTLSGKILVIGGYDPRQEGYKNVELFNFDNISSALSLWKPTVTDSQCIDCALTKSVRITGSDFTEAWEGSSGQTNQSPTNQPVVQLYRLDNQQIQWLSPAAASSDTRFQSTPFAFPDGLAIAFVYVNGSFQGKVVRLTSLPYKNYLPHVMK
jgi:N-acetylneuraminic acid mutarotase